MVRNFFKKIHAQERLHTMIKKYKVPKAYFSFNRKYVAKAALIGIFIALIPMPFQMVAVVVLLPIFRYNIIIAMFAVWLSNPLTMPAMYYIEYLTGTLLLGTEPIHDIELTLTWFQKNFSAIVLPLYTGTFFYGFTLAPLSYFLINKLWIDSVSKERHAKTGKKPIFKRFARKRT